jgi:3-oxoacyl-[acyl-carrier-protein] synthase III
MIKHAYITRISKFLPHSPVSNDEIESKLGLVNNQPSKSRAIVLRNNGIKTRYYAIDEQGNFTHNNVELTCEAIRSLVSKEELQQVDLLACGTSSPDQMMPAHALMVHGELTESPSFEVVSPAGNCCSSIHGLKYAFNSIRVNDAKKAIVTGSESFARRMQGVNFEEEIEKLRELEENPYIAFEKDFLRWMLSDGSAAVLVEDEPNKEGLSLRIDSIDMCSYAQRYETCMYMGGDKNPDGSFKGYLEYAPKEWIEQGVFAVKQDVKLLRPNIVAQGFEKMVEVFKNHNLTGDDISWFLPHMSSEFFRKPIAEALKQYDIDIPQERWFTNLTKVGNVGAASAFMMLEEMMREGMLEKGQRVFVAVPESARFTYAFVLLTVV